MPDVLDEIETHIPALRRYARALTRNADRADDLVQDCLERAIRKRGLFRPTGSLRSWLYRILVNVYRNDLQSRRYAVHQPLDGLEREPAAPPAQHDSLALSELALAIDALPADQREALLLVVLESQSYAEAATILDIPMGTLMSRLGRARASLRQTTGAGAPPRLRTVK